MADDIQIKTGGGGTFDPQATGGSQTVGTQAGNTGGLTDGAPVIDLRSLDQKPATPANPQVGTSGAIPATTVNAATPVTTGTAGSTAGGTGSASPITPLAQSNAGTTEPAAKPKSGALVLDGEDGFVSNRGQKYKIPSVVKEKFPDLIQLIQETESMNDDEREYWFQILPIMTEDQIKKFRDILVNEKEQLSKLDKEYETELNKLNEKHLLEWKEFETKEKRKALTDAEQKSKVQEKAEEEDLLKRLSQV